MWVEFVVGSRFLRELFSGFSGFPRSTQTNISRCQFDQERGPGCLKTSSGWHGVLSKYRNIVAVTYLVMQVSKAHITAMPNSTPRVIHIAEQNIKSSIRCSFKTANKKVKYKRKKNKTKQNKTKKKRNKRKMKHEYEICFKNAK